MKKDFGLWIDHKKAVIVNMMDGSIRTMLSGLEQVFPASGSHGFSGIGAKDFPAEDIHDRHMDKHLQLFYEQVAKTIQSPDHLYVFGPGEAKIEFTRVAGRLGAKVEAVEPADHLTDRQIVAKVRQHFVNAA